MEVKTKAVQNDLWALLSPDFCQCRTEVEQEKTKSSDRTDTTEKRRIVLYKSKEEGIAELRKLEPNTAYELLELRVVLAHHLFPRMNAARKLAGKPLLNIPEFQRDIFVRENVG